MDPVLAAKWLSVAVLGVGSMSIGLLPPICVQRYRNAPRVLSPFYRGLLSCFLCLGAGVLFGTSLVHITREARPVLSTIRVGIPVTETLLGSGFLFVYFVEEVVHLVLHCCSRKERRGSIPASRRREPNRVVNYAVHYSSLGDGPPCYGSVKICPQDPEERGSESEEERGEDGGSRGRSLSMPLLPHQEPPDEDDNPPTPATLFSHASVSSLSPASSSLLLLALSLHSTIEGLTIGLEATEKDVMLMLTAVSIHKFVIAFCLGMETVLSGMEGDLTPPPLGKSTAYIGVFSLTSVLGVFTGLMIKHLGLNMETEEMACAMLQAIAAGALLHVALLEILPRERSRCHRIGLLQFLAVALGYGISLGLEYSTIE